MARPIRALIDCAALRHNLHVVRQRAPNSRLMAVVKANAYGHGIEQIATCMGECQELVDAYAVASVDEALMLRQVGIQQPVVLLEGIFASSEIADVLHHGFEVVLHSYEQLEMLRDVPQTCALRLWIKVDTGMHRLGFQPSELADVWHKLQALNCTNQPIGIMSHFANSDVTDDERNTKQRLQLLAATAALPAQPSLLSMANSAAIVQLPDSHFHWVRPGLMMYGVTPCDATADALGLQPVMTLVSRVIALKTVAAEEQVGYGGCWQASQDTRLAILAVGYGDGYPRHLPSGTPVLVNGQRVPLVGRVSMDMIAVDVSTLSDIKVGDPAVLWGKGLPIDEIASAAGTISYELLCGITRRVPAVLAAADASWYQAS